MTREQKIIKRKERAKKRKNKRNEKYRDLVSKAQSLPWGVSLRSCRIGGYWVDETSSTGYKQVCDYMGNCEYPCDGSC